MASIIWYRIPQVVFLTLSATGASLMNHPVYRTDFKLFKNVTNEVDLFVKDQDRKPVSLVGKTVTINVVDDRVNKLVFSKQLAIVDEYRGLARLTTTPPETSQWDTGFLSFTITFGREDGTDVLLYTDENYGAKSVIEVVDGPVPPPVPSTVIPFSAFLQVSQGFPLQTFNVSGPYAGPAQVGNDSAIQSVAVYTTNYYGQFWVQASLDNQSPTQDTEWFNVPIGATTDFFHFMNVSGVTYFSIRGNFMWVRFRSLDDTIVGPNGTLDQVLYRN
jgi:hypothetical protein